MNNEQNDEVVYLYLDDIIPNRFQPREIFDEKALKELAVSIREHGVIQPIIVRNVGGKYEIIAGERRYKASALAGLTKIPAIIRDLDDKESSKVALLENLQRKNLSPIEEARTYQKILEIDQMTQEELAKTMGKSQSSVANKLRLLLLPEEIQDALLKEQISERHARSLLNIPDTKKQKEMLRKIISNKMSVRNLEEEIRQMYPKDEDISPIIASEQNFVNSSSLMPTIDLSTPTNTYGKVTISPPIEGEQKFINYDTITDDIEDNNDGDSSEQSDFHSSVGKIDIDKLKENTNDINFGDISQSGGLDSLLNIGQNLNNSMDNAGEIKFTKSTEDIGNDLNSKEPTNNIEYFTPSVDDTFDEMSLPNIMTESKEDNYTIELATSKIRDLIDDLKKHGIDLKTDEMNFEKSYQIIIKINK